MIKRFFNNALAILAGMCTVTAAAAEAPVILTPRYMDAGIIDGMSNNGKYGVSSIRPGSDGFSYTVGSVFYDLTGNEAVATDIGKGHASSGVADVTDDGKLVVGTVDHQPGICRFNGTDWTWETLPVPDMSVEFPMEDFNTGEVSIVTYKLNGGDVRAVTPDGKYAVGVARCNEYELFEQAVMWDLTTMSIVEVDSPKTNYFGINDFQTRYMQISDDGRYLLCWNSFSYAGNLIFVFDREKNEAIYIDCKMEDGRLKSIDPSYSSIEMDGLGKSLTSDGRYVTGGIGKGDLTYVFLFDVFNRELKIFDDGVHDSVTAWSVTKDGMPLGATPAATPYADALIITDSFFYPFESLYRDVFGMKLSNYDIDNTGKPTLVSDDGKTIVFITETSRCYVARFEEPIQQSFGDINLISNWRVYPESGSKMTSLENVTLTFDNPVATDASKYQGVRLTDSDGNVVANPLPEGGLKASGMQLNLKFSPITLEEGKVYTLSIAEGTCWLNGHPEQTNNPIEVKYTGRQAGPVKLLSVSPASGTSLSMLDVADNPVIVHFDGTIRINGTSDERPIATLYIDDSKEAAAYLGMDIDLSTGNLVIYPNAKYFLYKGSEYRIDVPAGVVTDISGEGPSEAFSLTYSGAYVPQLGNELYLFSSTCDDFSNFLFYDGDGGVPTVDYASMGFTATGTPWWVVMDDESNPDMAFASHSSYEDHRQSDDWLVIRQLSIPSDVNSYLAFQSQSYRKYKTDRLKVYVYEDDAVYNQLNASVIDKILDKGELVYNEIQSPGRTEETMAGEWTDNVIPLDKYKGKNIYICFLNDNKDQSMVMVDNIQVVKEVKSFLTVTSSTNVVDRKSTPVRGIVTVSSDLVAYNNLEMTLSDSKDNVISTIKASGLGLKNGDTYNFDFPEELPLVVGEENPFTIKYVFDDDTPSVYSGVVRDLAFEPVKRVVLEEYTGRDCMYCPLGMAALDRLESLYGSRLIPIALHCYNNSDPKGEGMTEYASAVFMGSTAAPNGRINRRPNIVAPMYSDNSGKYHMSASDVEGSSNTWQDEIVDEFSVPAFLDLELRAVPSDDPAYVDFNVSVKSALNLEEQNLRVLGVLLEDNLLDRQVNGIYSFSDPMLGEFGQGGAYGNSTFFYYFNNVARGYWGQSSNGTPRLLPSTIETGKSYDVKINYAIPPTVESADNLRMVVMLIDEITGRVINAAVADAEISGVDDIEADLGAIAPVVYKSGSDIVVESGDDVEVSVFSLDGRLLRSAHGSSQVVIGLDGYRGLVIVNAASRAGSSSVKLMM